ncbi:MAG: putative sugar O-methyltransferase [bacterium]
MNILFVVSHRDLIDPFESVLLELTARGHRVRLGVAAKKVGPTLPPSLAAQASIESVGCPPDRRDDWAESARLLRAVRDYSLYLAPRYGAADRLRQRMQRMLVRVASAGRAIQLVGHCPVCAAKLTGDHWASLLSELDETERGHIERLLAQVETVVPIDPAHRKFLERERPHILVVTSSSRVDSRLVDFVKAAQALEIPVAAPVASWDDLSADGCLHVIPDRLLVWNDLQRRAALEIHGVPSDRLVVTGAPRFDALHDRPATTSRGAWCAAHGIATERPIVTFLGATPFVAPAERAFMDRWLASVRGADDDALRTCAVVVRPHPRNRAPYEAQPFAGDTNVTVDLSDDPDTWLDGLTHSSAAVGLNTGALVEAAVLGTSAHTLLVPEFAGGQQNTLHFRHLLRASGGFVDAAGSLQEHVDALALAIANRAAPDRAAAERFVWATDKIAQATRMTVEVLEELGVATRRGVIGPIEPVLSRTPSEGDAPLPVAGSLPTGVSPSTGSAAPGSAPQPATRPVASEALTHLLEGTDLSWLASDSTISEFWKGQIAAAREKATKHAGSQPVSVADVVGELGYGFKPLAPGLQIDEDPSLQRVLGEWQQVQPLLRRSGSKAPGFSLDEWEHLSAVAWLKDEQMFDAYLAFIRPFEIRSSMTTARHYYRTMVLERLRADHLEGRELRILEVGAGAGNLAVFLLSRRLAASYVIIDLPEMLMNAAININRYWPEATLHFDELPDPAHRDAAGHVHLVRTTRIADLDPDQFDAMLNFNSFMEMDQATRDMYIREMYRTARDGAILYNVNRRQQRLPQPDGSLFDNNPLFFPYASQEHVLFWEDDPFETAVRAWFGKRPSLSIARAEIVRKPDR